MRSLALLLLLFFATPSCTLCKPVVCAVTMPILLLSEGGVERSFHCGNSDGAYGIAAAMGAASVFGVVVGLFTGIVSDINVMTGRVDTHHASDNLTDPFKTNDM